jgi:integrase
LILTNPAEAVELPEIESTERGTFTRAEVKLLVDAAEGEWKLLIPLAYYTAARLGDCCRMQWDGLDLACETLTYSQRVNIKNTRIWKWKPAAPPWTKSRRSADSRTLLTPANLRDTVLILKCRAKCDN